MTNAVYAQVIEMTYGPAGHKLATEFLMAAADAHKCRGKKTLFGRDKWPPAHDKFIDKVQQLALMLRQTGQIAKLDPKEIVAGIHTLVGRLRMAYPNWPDSYTYWEWFKSVQTFPNDKSPPSALPDSGSSIKSGGPRNGNVQR
jgi:hypothetical protein